MEANIRWTKRRQFTRDKKPTHIDKLLNGPFEYFLEAFMYDEQLQYSGKFILLGGPLKDMDFIFHPSGYVRNGIAPTDRTVEEMMAKYRTAAREKILRQASARQNQSNMGRCLTYSKLDKGTDVEFFKPTKSIHNLDIIGYLITDEQHPDNVDGDLPVGTIWPSRTYWVHSNIGTEGTSVICPARTWGERCPICEYANQLKRRGDSTKEELDALRPKQRQLFNVIDRDNDPDKVMLMDMSYHLFGRQLDKELKDSEEDDVFDFYLPKEGFTIRARFEKKSFNGREFYECDRIDFRERKPYKDSIVDKTLPLDDLLNHIEYDKLNEIFLLGGEAAAGEIDEDGERRLRREREKERRRRNSRHDTDVDDAADEPEGDDEEQEEEKPRGRSRRGRDDEESDGTTSRAKPKPRHRDPEPEDDPDPDSDDSDEPEDEPPARGRGRRASSRDKDDDGQDDEPRSSRRTPRRGSEDMNDDPEPEDEPPARDKGKRGGEKKKACPHGARFGVDCDRLDECDGCKMWAPCNAAMRD